MDSRVTLTQNNPHDNANIFSKLFLLWSFRLFRRGYKNGLSIDELFRGSSRDASSALGDRLEEAWYREVKEAKKHGTKPSLSKAIVKSFWVEYMLCGILIGLNFLLLFPLIPYTLSQFIEYFSGPRNDWTYMCAHYYNLAMNLISMATSLFMNHSSLNQSVVGMRIRVACCSLMYRKILKLDRAALGQTDPGQVVNMMSNDVNRFDLVVLFLHYLWVMPVLLPIACYLVWQHIGLATLAALAVIFLQSVLVQAYLSSRQGVLRGKIANRTDERVKVMTELVNGVQVIKMYAWEIPFAKLVNQLRKLEVNFIMKTSLIKGFSTALTVFTERFILYVALVTFVLMGGVVRSSITFSLVQYFNQLQLACNIFFPMALAFLAETRVTVNRLEEFLMLDELPSARALKANGVSMKQVENGKPEVKSKPTGLVLAGVGASWTADPIVDTLRNINLTAKPGEFIGIVGSVGSGKSSLLQVILGELTPSKGSMSLGGGTISYASQEPWLFVATVRQNILFGSPYVKDRYKKVVKACALLRDFELLPAGDSTMVGERGISLSGGQRARIGLARACYRQADIYLLDDPLSAVDTHVGKQLVTDCIQGLLRDSTRIVVTHQLHHLKNADNLYILKNGEIEAQGTFDEVSNSPLFSELLQEEEEEEAQAPKKERQRAMSIQSHVSLSTVDGNEEEDQEETDELMEKGRVSGSVYRQYFSAGGGVALLLLTVVSILLAQLVTSAADLWLTHWMNDVEAAIQETNVMMMNTSQMLETTTMSSELYLTTPEDFDNISTTEYFNDTMATEIVPTISHDFYIYIWTLGILGCIVLTTFRSVLFLWVCMRSSVKLHNKMFHDILHATMRFFDTNPSGRILNRFSKDMGTIDEILPRMYLDSIQICMVMIGILAMVAIVNPFMLLTTAACAVLMYIWTIMYLNTAQDIKRIEGVTRSPVFSHVTASMAGVSTARACHAQDMLVRQFDDKQDVHTAAWHLTLLANTAFSVWLCLISTAYVAIVSYTFLLRDDGTTKSGDVGLALSQSLILVNMVQYGIKQATEVISQMTSVERILQFTKLPLEDTDGPAPPSTWPQRAKLVFKDLYLRYDKEAEPVLKNLNIVIESGWKVGVVGRTGAGKSSLISALFRLAPLEGHVYIDDVDTGSIALKELRSKIAIIPQEPVLFSASLRYNMDPFDRYSDADIWRALEQVELKNSVSALSSAVAAGGANFSAGQRQLLCLARAALARNKLLVLDEATANVDPNTDALIQKSIRSHFRDCTVLTVAHRLHTVADADRVVVMDAGQIVECGHPHELLQTEGPFTGMVRQLGPAAEQSLRELALNAHKQHIRYVDSDEVQELKTD